MKKYWTHHQGKPQNDVSNIFIIDFKQSDFYKSPKDLANKGLLASLFDSNRNSNMSLGVTVPVTPQPWGCYLRQIIDAERVCKLACKRACKDCSTSVVYNTTRCVAPRIKQSAEA